MKLYPVYVKSDKITICLDLTLFQYKFACNIVGIMGTYVYKYRFSFSLGYSKGSLIQNVRKTVDGGGWSKEKVQPRAELKKAGVGGRPFNNFSNGFFSCRPLS